MAYVAGTEAGAALYTRMLDQFVAQPIAGTAGVSAPFFSPDGSRVGFFANGELRTVPISGRAATHRLRRADRAGRELGTR